MVIINKLLSMTVCCRNRASQYPWVHWQIEVERVGLMLSLLPLGMVTLISVALNSVSHVTLADKACARLFTCVVLVQASSKEQIFLKTIIIFNALL